MRPLCALLGVNRSWYYQHSAPREPNEEQIALRDAIERIVLEMPGYGYRSGCYRHHHHFHGGYGGFGGGYGGFGGGYAHHHRHW